mgnify:FL=1
MGHTLIEALQSAGTHKLTALTRNAGGTGFPKGIRVVQVDYYNHEALVDALRGQDCLVIILAASTPGEVQINLVRAAAAAGVRWVFPDSWATDHTHAFPGYHVDYGGNVEGAIAEIDRLGKSSWISFICSFWYESALAGGPLWLGFDIPGRSVEFIEDGKTKFNVSTRWLCGEAFQRLLNLPETLAGDGTDSNTAALSNWRNQPLRVSSFLVSQRDILDSIHRVLGTTDADWKIEFQTLEERLKKADKLAETEPILGYGLEVHARRLAPGGYGDYETPFGTANELLGLEKEDLDEATAKILKMFNRQG